MTQSLGNTTKFSSQEDFRAEYGPIALRFFLLELARRLLPNERIRVCWRYPLPARSAIEIIYSDERQCARSQGTMKCGSGWVCPVCMRYIAERRRQELEIAIGRTSDKWFPIMITYTSRHTHADRLRPLLATMLKAYNSTFSGRWWSEIKREYMVMGAIRATEITYGLNGWHPHFHVIALIDRAMLNDGYAGSPDEYCQSVTAQFGDRWLDMLEKHGLSGTQERAIDVRSADKDITDYISKFGRMPQDWRMTPNTYEVSHAVTKMAKNGNFSVLDLLFASQHKPQYGNLFLEYHHATKGRSQLQWSKGLKTALDIEIVRDEIAAQGIETDTDRLLAEIDLTLWQYIAHYAYTGQLMTIANTGDDDRLRAYLDKLRTKQQNATQTIRQFDLGH